MLDNADTDSKGLSKQFHELDSPQSVAALLDINFDLVKYLLYAAPEDKKYREFSIPKKSGGIRHILAPSSQLKHIQRRLNSTLQAVYQPKQMVHGFLSGKGIVSNARMHVAKKYVLNIDIENFFPSINFGRVRGMFMARPYDLPPQVATVLAQICCFQNQLPQGAPTSPIISNMICGRMDDALTNLAGDEGWAYTRYADDLSFSAIEPEYSFDIAYFNDDNGFEYLIHSIGDIQKREKLKAVVGYKLRQIITSNGFYINRSKVRLQVNWQHQEVTGLTTNRFPNVSRKYIRQVRAMLHAWRKHGFEATQKEYLEKYCVSGRDSSNNQPSFKKVLKGKIEFIGMVRGKNDSIYINLWNQLVELAPELGRRKITAKVVLSDSTTATPAPKVYTEGKTDWKHLKAALANLQKNGLFQSLELLFDERIEERGDDDLLRLCTHLSQNEQKMPVICIFDRDNIEMVKKVSANEAYKNWGNNVFSFAIPVPTHRQATPNVCIELYYTDDEIKTYNKNGRRLFLSSEFHSDSLRHVDPATNLNCTAMNAFRKPQPKIVDDKVFDGQNNNVALSKNDFADGILTGATEFSFINFTAFEFIFKIVKEIIDSTHLRSHS